MARITEVFLVQRGSICILKYLPFAQHNAEIVAGHHSHKNLVHGLSASTHLLMPPANWSKPGLNLLLMKEKEEDTLIAIISS